MRIIVAFCVFGTAALLAAQEIGFLDVSAVPIQQRLREPLGGIGQSVGGKSLNSGSASAQVLLNLKLRPVSSSGQEIDYEIQLTNIGQERIVIPWTPSPRDVEPEDPSASYTFIVASLTLWAVTETGGAEVLSSALLFGSEASSTLKELAPGQSVRIRARTKIEGEPNLRPTRVRASWSTSISTFHPNRPERSQIGTPPVISNEVVLGQVGWPR
jgi:hypothetical protein